MAGRKTSENSSRAGKRAVAKKGVGKRAAKAASKSAAGKKTVTKKAVASKSAAKKQVARKHAAATGNRAKPEAGRVAARKNVNPERVESILAILAETYPQAECALVHASPWQLLVATILSAQCTDARVNMVTPKLFAAYPTPEAMAGAELTSIEELIRTTGFFHNKAKSIQGAGRVITDEFGGQVPRTMAELLKVPGAARKTANVVLGVAYGLAEGVVVDTHVFRLSRRLGLSRGETAPVVEQDLMKVIPRDRWIQFSHELIHHGRQICEARKPKCAACPIETLCQAPDKTWSS